MSPVIAPLRHAVAQACTAAIGSGPPAPAVIESYDWYEALLDLVESSGGVGQVAVQPQKMTDGWLSRGKEKRNPFIDVAVQYKVKTTPPSPAELDPYMGLTENLVSYFKPGAAGSQLTLTNPSIAVCVGVEWRALWVPEHLQKDRVFTSVFTLEFQIND